MPLALVSLGQTCALLVGGFDVSVAALMTFCVVVASYTMTFDDVGVGVASRGPRAHRRGAGDRDLQRRAHPRPQASVDHRDARDLQHPRGRIAPPAGSPRGPDLERRHRRSHEERQLRSDRLRRRRRPRRRSATCGCTARARGLATAGGRPRRDVVASARDGDGPDRVPRVRRVLADGVARRLLPCGPGPDRLADHRQLRPREHRRGRSRRSEPRGRARVVRRARCWRRSSSR